MTALWIYGIGATAPGGAPLGEGVCGAAVQVLPVGGFHAIVSVAPEEPPAQTRRHMLAHTAVLERATAAVDLLPVRFGSVAPDEAALGRCLAAHAKELHAALGGIADSVELGLRASWKEGVVFKEILDADAGLRALRDKLQARPALETYQARIELGRRVEAALIQRREAECAALLKDLTPLTRRDVALRSAEESAVLHRAFLVRRAEEARFDEAVAALEARHGARIAFRYVGPVPPFNFVSLRAEWLGTQGQA
jgi:hypothetical protein